MDNLYESDSDQDQAPPDDAPPEGADEGKGEDEAQGQEALVNREIFPDAKVGDMFTVKIVGDHGKELMIQSAGKSEGMDEGGSPDEDGGGGGAAVGAGGGGQPGLMD